MKKRSWFTLIELMVVIVIIGVIMGLLLPTLTKAKVKAKRTQALSEINALKTAIKLYESTYGYLPGAGAEEEVGDDGFIDLIGDLSCTGGRENPRRMIMLDVEAAATYNDPWGQRYYVVIDTDYDGNIAHEQVSGVSTDVTSTIAIWSEGPDGQDATQTTDDDITSFKK